MDFSTIEAVQGTSVKGRCLTWFRRALLRPVTSFSCHMVLQCIRYWIEYIAVPFAIYYNWTHMASDGQKSNEGVRISRNITYGDVPGEEMDELSPETNVGNRGTILYVHGGGFVCVHRGVMNHSITPLVRAGFRVFSMDYPLAPDYKFPIPILSILKCLVYIREHYQVEEVRLVADSAGGSLASVAVSIVHNMEAGWGDVIDSYLSDHKASFPYVSQIALFYSICDEDAWKDNVSTKSGRVQNAIMSFCLEQHKRSQEEGVTILGNIDKLLRFPSTFLLCGEHDPLQHSHNALAQQLMLIGTQVVNVIIKDGFHGFHGLPVPFSFGLWRKIVYPANKELIKWLTKDDSGTAEHFMTELPEERMRGEHDLSLVFVIAAVHMIAGSIIAYIAYILIYQI